MTEQELRELALHRNKMQRLLERILKGETLKEGKNGSNQGSR